jgi:hypothetical protein
VDEEGVAMSERAATTIGGEYARICRIIRSTDGTMLLPVKTVDAS